MVYSNVLPNTLVPVKLSGQLRQVIDAGFPHDVLIGGIPFRLKPSDEHPLLNQLLDDMKDQVDTSPEAGENSFGTWWLRSQSTFHGGEGQKYLDGPSEAERHRYLSSRYVFPHEAGEATIAGVVDGSMDWNAHHAVAVIWGGVPKIAHSMETSNNVVVLTLPGLTDNQYIPVGPTSTAAPADLTTDGVNIFVAVADKVYRVGPDAVPVLIANVTFTGPVVLGYAKQRLVLCVGPKVYELDPAPAAPATPSTPHYTNPASGFVYTCVADGPNAIYLTGYSGMQSYVSSMTVTESGGTLVLGVPVVQLRLPPSELANAIFFYTGSLFALATTSGARIGNFTPYGQPVMGPLSIVDVPCYSLTGFGSLIWVGAKGSAWWIDLSTQLAESGAYARSMYLDGLNGNLTDILVHPQAGKNLLFASTSTGYLVQQKQWIPAPVATLTTSWVRFGTTELKRLHYISVEGNFPKIPGVQYVMTVRVESSAGDFKEFNITGDSPYFEFSTDGLSVAKAFRLVFTLRDDGLSDHGVLLRSWQMKALPIPQRYPEVVLPLMCNDFEQPASGERLGYLGFAADRLAALFALGRRSDRVSVVVRPWNLGFRGVISRMQFEQVLPPTPTNGTGGIINVVLRSV